MKIKITFICPDCACTTYHEVAIKDPGEGMLDIHKLDIDVSDTMCHACIGHLDEDDKHEAYPRVSWEKK